MILKKLNYHLHYKNRAGNLTRTAANKAEKSLDYKLSLLLLNMMCMMSSVCAWKCQGVAIEQVKGSEQ